MKKTIYLAALLALSAISCTKEKEEAPAPINTTITNPPQVNSSIGFLSYTDWTSSGSGLYYQIKSVPSVYKLLSVHIEVNWQPPYFPLPVTLSGIEYSYAWNDSTKEIMVTARDLTAPYNAPTETINYLINFY
jgi:hypothetical protein